MAGNRPSHRLSPELLCFHVQFDLNFMQSISDCIVASRQGIALLVCGRPLAPSKGQSNTPRFPATAFSFRSERALCAVFEVVRRTASALVLQVAPEGLESRLSAAPQRDQERQRQQHLISPSLRRQQPSSAFRLLSLGLPCAQYGLLVGLFDSQRLLSPHLSRHGPFALHLRRAAVRQLDDRLHATGPSLGQVSLQSAQLMLGLAR